MVKKIASYIGEFKKDTIMTPIYIGLEVAMEVMIPFLMAWIIDNGVGKGDVKYVTMVGIGMLIASFLSLTFGIIAGKTGASASSGFARNLRKGMFYNIQDFSFYRCYKCSKCISNDNKNVCKSTSYVGIGYAHVFLY